MLAEGHTVGPYQLVRSLGEGTLAEVWLAHHRDLGGDRAMKFLTDAECVRRLRAELMPELARRHPNIVRTFEADLAHDPPYVVMDYVEGESLRQRLTARGALPAHEALGIVRQVLRALQTAHAAAVLHRDLRPENILLTPHGAVKVAGFGLGKVQAELAVARGGACDYMSPEQQRGLRPAPDDDLYAVGLLACELLTGSRPAGARVAQAGLPEPIAEVIARACDERGFRYPSALDMLADVARLPTGVPELVTNSLGMRLRRIPPGPFLMGSDDGPAWERPAHEVALTAPFYLGVCPVTQAQYERVVGSNPSAFRAPERPVENVSWHDAQDFCRRLSDAEGIACRLPTEAEWEYACRAEAPTAYCFGDSDWQLPHYAWLVRNSGHTELIPAPKRFFGLIQPKPETRLVRETHSVGEKKPNDWGLHDMHGNVSEWCLDWYAPYRPDAQADPQGPAQGTDRIVRGGSWCSTPSLCRSAARDYHAPGYASNDIGFRLVQLPP